MKLALIAIGLLGLGFAGIAVKIWAKKGGQFAGTCASNNPVLNAEGESCSVCGARPDEQCMKDEVVA
ncbi:MAG: membrane or secreted protein [Flavobacteriales bacterium]|nr:membrane or secreted protein [Flavobacteriales bacterium]